MLEKVDLKKSLNKEEYKEMIGPLQERLGELQRWAKQREIPVLIVFAGWEAAGKGTLINDLIQALDPRGFDVHTGGDEKEEAVHRPYFWRFWTRTPRKGRITIFDRSWYAPVLSRLAKQEEKDVHLHDLFKDALSFEQQLSDAGTLVIKFFLHISKREQKERMAKLEKNPATAWRVKAEDWKQNLHYEKYQTAIEEMLRQTDTEHAPWTIVEAHDRRFAAAKIAGNVVQRLERIVRAKAEGLKAAETKRSEPALAKVFTSSVLSDVDLTRDLSEAEYQERLKKGQKRLRELEYICYSERLPVIIAFEGWDAAGKGGCIRRLTENMDPRGYSVIPVAAPTEEERAQHYLWRFWRQMPKAGHIAIFDRTWYGRVLVERVEGFCQPEEWRRAYREINEMEEQWSEYGAVLAKFWLHIDQAEQKQRFEARMAAPEKQWKITEEDWRNREKWTEYEEAINEMFFRTSTTHAPWTIVEANSKLYARIKVIETVITALEESLQKKRK